MVKERRNTVLGISAVAVAYVAMEAIGITCPIKFVTGISCAGCGMSRAWLSVLRADFQSAAYYHPLWFMPVIVLVLVIFRKRIPERVLRGLLIICAAVFLGVYIWRMLFEGGDIVVFEPWNGAWFRF